MPAPVRRGRMMVAVAVMVEIGRDRDLMFDREMLENC